MTASVSPCLLSETGKFTKGMKIFASTPLHIYVSRERGVREGESLF
jgi:hypothetical protein